MENLTYEETQLLCIYNSTGTRAGVIAALTEMRGCLEPDEDELRALTDSALELAPDFDLEAPAYGE